VDSADGSSVHSSQKKQEEPQKALKSEKSEEFIYKIFYKEEEITSTLEQ